MLDLVFALSGNKIPADHGYFLHSALSGIFPVLHNMKQRGNTGVHPIYGIPCGNRMLALGGKSRLILRIPADKVADYLELCGRQLEIGSEVISVETPSSRKLRPAAALKSRLVTIKGFTSPHEFLDAAHRQLQELNIRGKAHLIPRKDSLASEDRSDNRETSPFIKRTISIKGKSIVGFALVVTDLTADESLLLQISGLGGRRTMGCGIFVPAE